MFKKIPVDQQNVVEVPLRGMIFELKSNLSKKTPDLVNKLIKKLLHFHINTTECRRSFLNLDNLKNLEAGQVK